MAIIKGTRLQKKDKIKASINSDVAAKINEYCAWANIEDIGFFIEEAANFVFNKDREWKQYNKTNKNTQQV